MERRVKGRREKEMKGELRQGKGTQRKRKGRRAEMEIEKEGRREEKERN